MRITWYNKFVIKIYKRGKETQKMKKNKGITLIALVITIIVLLILAGVSLNLIAGENGILTRAETATIKHQFGKQREELEMVIAAERIDRVEKGKIEVFAKSIKEAIERECQEGSEQWVKYVLMTDANGNRVENPEECMNLVIRTTDEYEIKIEINNEKSQAKVVEHYVKKEPDKMEIRLDKENITLTTFARSTKTYQLVPTVSSIVPVNDKVEWNSSNPEIASVDENGLVTAKAAGSAKIVAKVKGLEGIEGYCNVEVKEHVIQITNGFIFAGDENSAEAWRYF